MGKPIFAKHDQLTGDGVVIELDGDRLVLRSSIDGCGERVLIVLDGRSVARELGEALVSLRPLDSKRTASPRRVAL